MTDLEDLLVRTLRDPGRAIPAAADPMTGIRSRARTQRRTTALAVAAVVAVLAAIAVPTAVLRTDPAALPPAATATPTPPAGTGPLDWAPRGELAGDASVRAVAERAWRTAPDEAVRPDGAVWLLWAGALDDRQVVLLQGRVAGGRAYVARTIDGGLTVEPLNDPDALAVHLVQDGMFDGTRLLLRPGAQGVRLELAAGADREEDYPVGDDALVKIPWDSYGLPAGRRMSVLDASGRVLGVATGPIEGRLVVPGGNERATRPTWRAPVESTHGSQVLIWGGYLATLIGGSGPVDVAPVADSTEVTTAGGLLAPRTYEVRRGGRVWLTSAVWVGNTPYCVQAQEITGRVATTPAYVVRCHLPALRTGLLQVVLADDARLTRLTVAAGGPGQGRQDRNWPTPVDGGVILTYGADFPTGAGRLTLVDAAGKPLPAVEVPAYS